MKKRVIILVASLIVCAVAIAACGTGPKGSASSAGSGFGSAYSSGSGGAYAAGLKYKTIGKEGGKSTTKQVLLQNLTGQDIKAFVLKHSGEETFGANMLEAGDIFAPDEVRRVLYDTKPAQDAAAAKKMESDGSAIHLQYDLEITTADDKKYVIHNFPLDSLEMGNIVLEDEVMFLEYTDPLTGKDINTKKEELSVKESEKKAQEEKAAAEKAAAEQAAAEAAAAEAAAAEAAAAWQAQQEAAAWAAQQQAAQQPVMPNTPAGGGDDGCIGDGGLVY